MAFGDQAKFEKGLRADLPRGLKGQEDRLPRTLWAEPQELTAEWEKYRKGAALFLGYRGGREIGWSDDRHALTVAGTRAGKGASLIIPNLLQYDGSVLAIDPKGELARITGRYRESIGDRFVLDPFGENGRWPTAHYNPMDELDPNHREVIDQAGSIADALVIYSGKGDPHWTSAARGVLRGLILMLLDFDQSQRNLVAMREVLMLVHPAVQARHDIVTKKMKPEDQHKASKGKTLAEMMIAMGDRFERVVCGQGEALRDMADKERESVLSEARTQTQFLDSPALRDILKTSSFSLKDLSRKKVSVFLCLPARHMNTHDRWLRVIVNLAIDALEPRRGPQRVAAASVPVLLLLEEFPVLGTMEKLEAAAGQLAGSGVKLWVIIQNLGQLKRHYKQGWETFIANSGVLTAFGNADLETLEYLAKKMGKVAMNVVRRSGASPSQLLDGAAPQSEELRDAALLEVDELSHNLAREKKRVLVLAAGQPPLVLERAQYFSDAHFKGLFDE